jgi:acyl dehydratase
VTRVKIREFADAVDARSGAHFYPEVARAEGYPDVIAPTTFAVLIAQKAEFHVVVDPEVGVDFSKVVHADERFTHHRPLVAGDVVTTTVTIESVVQRAGISMVSTRAEIVDGDNAPVATVVSSLVVREDA